MTNVKYIHHHFPNMKNNNYKQFCVAYIINPLEVKFGIAFCSEDRYNKSVGRKIADIRLEKSCLTLYKDYFMKKLFNSYDPYFLEETLEYSVFKLPLSQDLQNTINLTDIRNTMIESIIIYYIMEKYPVIKSHFLKYTDYESNNLINEIVSNT